MTTATSRSILVPAKLFLSLSDTSKPRGATRQRAMLMPPARHKACCPSQVGKKAEGQNKKWHIHHTTMSEPLETRFKPNGEMLGTRDDLAKFLRENRRTLKLCRPEIWGDEETHTFLSRLQTKPFMTITALRCIDSRILDFTICEKTA